MSRRHVARDPRTGLPISLNRGPRFAKEKGLRPPEGPWSALLPDDILPLANGNLATAEVRWQDRRHLLTRADGVRALPRTGRRDDESAIATLELALRAKDPQVRKAGLDVLLYIALRGGEHLFDVLDERIDDADESVRESARQCLRECSPIFPSATEEILREQLRSEEKQSRSDAFEALTAAAKQWPEVGVIHVDELIREEDADLRRRGSKALRTFGHRAGAAGWDLIGWCLQDEDSEVRRGGARTLPTLANTAPEIAQLLIESSLFDEDEEVRKHSLRALGRIEKDSVRVRDLIVDGARHMDPKVRATCIEMLPIILDEHSRREVAEELLRQETSPELRRELAELARDPTLDGTEEEKNRYLAPAPEVEIDPAQAMSMSSMPKVERENSKSNPESAVSDSMDSSNITGMAPEDLRDDYPINDEATDHSTVDSDWSADSPLDDALIGMREWHPPEDSEDDDDPQDLGFDATHED